MNRCKGTVLFLSALALGMGGCSSKKADKSSSRKNESTAAIEQEEAADKFAPTERMLGGVAEEMPEEPAPEPVMAATTSPKKRQQKADARDSEDDVSGGKDRGGGGPGAGAESGPAPRAWFPETFLFEPLVVTDDNGTAEVRVKVPDRLTSWRVLGLAHSRSGSQAGAVATFEGTLPAYVDPVVPSFMRLGDSVRVPIQLVNNTDEAMDTPLVVEVSGGKLLSKPQAISIPKRSSVVRCVDVGADTAGTLRLMARMGERDTVVRTTQVVQTGQPTSLTHSGTLAAPRKVTLSGQEAEGASLGVATLSVYAGALALVRSELSAAVHRGGVAEDAFALLLAGKAPEILTALGEKPEEETLRALSITASQSVIRHARVLSIEHAALIAEAALAHPENPVLERLGKRAIATIEQQQAPDGTCGGASGWTLQRLLVATAECARAAEDSPNVTLRASGAFERNAKEISDPYTAAAILASGVVADSLATTLQAIVLKSIAEHESGAKYVKVPAGVVRPDGRRPSEVEATAMAVLALSSVEDAPLADLGATILASYNPRMGFGDGRANLVALEAAVTLFSDPLPEVVALKLMMDGEVVAEGELGKSSVREVVTLDAKDLDVRGAHEWSIVAEPAVPGLGYALEVTNWVPWATSQALGSELSVELEGELRVGKASDLVVQAVAPSGQPFRVALALPAGFQVDSKALDGLVASGVLRSFKAADGELILECAALDAGKRLRAAVRVIPTMAGKLQSGATTIEVGRQRGYIKPLLLEVKP